MFRNQHYEMFYDILDKIYNIKYLTEKEKQRVLKIKDKIKKKEQSRKII